LGRVVMRMRVMFVWVELKVLSPVDLGSVRVYHCERDRPLWNYFRFRVICSVAVRILLVVVDDWRKMMLQYGQREKREIER